MSNPVKGLTVYLNFTGNCEEALNFYAKVFDGKVTIRQRYDNPAMNTPEEFRDKVLHASLKFGPVTVLASDLAEGGKPGVPFEKQFWGAWHGNLTDRYGVRWMVNCDD